MQDYIQRGRMQVASVLDNFINEQALPGSGVEPAKFWQGFEAVLAEFVAPNKALLAKRDSLQAQIDDYHKAGKPANGPEYKQFLQDIGYLIPEPADFSIETSGVDAEMATMAGPQLVVPINNARYALNAANARWGSLYDALYGTDVISEEDGAGKTGGYNPVRGAKVVATAREWLNTLLPLANGQHEDAVNYCIAGNSLSVSLKGGASASLQDASQFKGFQGSVESPTALLFEHNGLHFEIQIDNEHPIGKTDPAGVKDILVEAALTTIMDCEDSVAAVDAEDKTLVYANWLGLMKGTLSITMNKGGKSFTRSMNADRTYQTTDGESLVLSGRSLMFVRNVGHLMTNDAILFDGEEVPEGIMDGVITSLIAKHDLLGNSPYKNTRTGSIYIVKPKMHGPEEVAFSNALFGKIEEVVGLEPFTLKMGIMDEERRTSVNLKACIAAAKQRTVFINTGFLDRTGDEIHTSMLAGTFADKASLKAMTWIQAYEKANVATGLACGLSGKAQIGKGMWPIPDQMAQMMAAKIGHPKSGANTAWVPSPTAATLHALHYHQVDVFGVQQSLASEQFDGIDDILTIPLLDDATSLTDEQIQREIDNNVQGILGYVVRWVHQGVGCSKVPDINNVGLMEDRATLRISSQHLANWLAHGVITEERVQASLERMAKLVDEQNAGDPEYIPMTPDTAASIGFQAASDLIFKGKEQPNGYTEPLLHQKRKEMKAALRNQ
ncbi:MAG: malate synthase G [Aestuariibacter sp.]|nr:malate synthase G [Alteromonadaceae bacterium]MCP4236962.1 malate synthase G [Aestuariibacter sp.]MCP5009219.1 malate synthase G [Aestuariibacter sp.]|tara:strand:+ start:664 stop:2838 length:2175 start_codon:yes stop_codon:yes gene_type:complete